MQSLQQPLNTLLITNVSPADPVLQWNCKPSSTIVNNECFFRSCSNTLKFQRDLWELSDSHTSHSTKCQLPVAKSDIPAKGHLQVTKPGIFLQELCWELPHCRDQALMCAECKSAPHLEELAHLLALQLSVCSGNIYWPIHTIDDTINGNLVPVKIRVIDPSSLVWRVFYKLRAKCCDLTDELQ